MKNPTKFKIESDLKTRLKKAGLTTRECAIRLGESPSTISNRLNGFLSLPEDKRQELESLINETLTTKNQRKEKLK